MLGHKSEEPRTGIPSITGRAFPYNFNDESKFWTREGYWQATKLRNLRGEIIYEEKVMKR